MITKHFKILYYFFLERKISTFFSILLFLIISSIDNMIIYLGFYEFFYFIKNYSLSYTASALIWTITIKFILGNIIFFHEKYRFGEIFFKNLKKFFISLPYNKELFGKNQQAENMLKFQWEMNIIANETNSSYTNILLNLARIISSFFFVILFIALEPKNFILLITTILFISTSYFLKHLQIKFDKNHLEQTDKKFLESNQQAFQYISENSLKHPREDYLELTKKLESSLKNLFSKIFLKKTLFETVHLFAKILYPFIIIYFSFSAKDSINYSKISEIMSSITYNFFLSFFSVKFIKLLFDRNLFNLIAQNNIAIINKNQNSENQASNSILVEDFEFYNVTLENNQNALKNLTFKSKIKDNICFVSESNNISIIRKFFEKKANKNSGEILINGNILEKFTNETIENVIITISKDVSIKNDTIKKNILPENSQISDEIIVKACKLSGFYEYIASLPFGYYTPITNETEFSPIQKFQFSLTKALLSDGHIIIADFTEIDENNKKIHEIKDMLISSLIDRILIIITNDTYQLNNLKNIIVIKDGEIVASGNHSNLIKNSSAYSDFFVKSYKNIMFAEQ